MALEWMSRTQYVCFGTLTNGMPDTQGWMLLALSPLLLLSFMWVTHTEELKFVRFFISNSKLAQITFLILAGFTLLVGHWTGSRVTYALRLARVGVSPTEPQFLPEDYPRLNQSTPPFKLLNQKAELMTESIFKGKVTILTFAFAHCSTICPVLIKDSLEALRRLDHPKTQVVVITIDPWRDTPSSLPSLVKTWSFTENSFLLSGKPDEVLKTLQGFQIINERDLKTGDVTHAAQVMIVDQNAKIQYSFLNPSPEWLASASLRLLKE